MSQIGSVKKVVVVQDASRVVHVKTVRWAMMNLPLKPGDMIRLFRVVQPFMADHAPSLPGCGICFTKPSTSFTNQRRGNGIRLHSSATILKRQESIEREIIEKQDESQMNIEIKHILRLAEDRQIDFEASAEPGNTLRDFTVQAAKDLRATYVILDSQMKRDQKYIMDNLTCGIFMMNRKGRVESLRDPKSEDVDPDNSSLVATSIDRANIQEELLFHDHPCTICGHKRLANGYFLQFSYAELAFSTFGFSQKYLLSKHRKRVYKGTLRSGLKIVIRKHFFATIKEEDFRSLAIMLSQARHENVATLLGLCLEGYHRFLVYEFVCNQTLYSHLSARSADLTWERRIKIALGTSKGLEYLHRNNIYGCVRPRNILLTHDYHPLLANFGLTKNPYEDLTHLSDTRVFKTFEYLAPEYDETGTDSSKTDVYSFGVVLLELLTGRKTLEETKGLCFLRWARPLLKEKMYHNLADPVMKEEFDLLELTLFVRVVEKCLRSNPTKRCTIAQVVLDLTDIAKRHSVRYSSPDVE